MQTRKIKVGVNSPIRFYVEVDYKEAENVAEIKQLSSDESYIAQCFTRGDVINHQDRSGARQTVERELRIAKAEAAAKGKQIKSMDDVDSATFDKIRAAAQKDFDSWERSSERRERRTVLNMTQAQYDAIPEEARAAMTSQGIVFNVRIMAAAEIAAAKEAANEQHEQDEHAKKMYESAVETGKLLDERENKARADAMTRRESK